MKIKNLVNPLILLILIQIFLQTSLHAQTAEEWFHKGLVSKDYQEKITYYTKAIELKPDDATAYYNRGVAKENLGKYQEAIEDYNKALEIKPDFAEAYNNRGVAKENLGKYQEAIEDYNKSLELKPDYEIAKNNLAEAKQKLAEQLPQTKRLALLIGNANYEKSPLKNPINDATDIAQALRNYGFETTLRTDLDLQTMENVIEEFSKQIKELKDQGYHVTALFYYSGYGLGVKSKRENYLLPLSNKLSSIDEIISIGYTSEQLMNTLAIANIQIMMLDVYNLPQCKNNSDCSYSLFSPTFPSDKYTIDEIAKLMRFLSFTISHSQDGVEPSSFYATAFLKVLKENSNIELQAFFAKLNFEVSIQTKGTQQVLNTDALMDNFYFQKD